jgi:hypothetical protein
VEPGRLGRGAGALDPDIEWRGATQLLGLPDITYGHEGCASLGLWTDSWTDIRAELEEIIEVESGALALIRWRARSPAGLTVDQPIAFHFEIHDHVVTRFVSYWERSQAFEPVGLPAPG